MNHPYLVVTCIIVLAFILLWKFLRRKHAVVSTYDYLEILSFQVWKSGRQINDEIEEWKGGWVSLAEMYQALLRLEDEGLVERNERPPKKSEKRGGYKVSEYKLTSGGIRRKDKLKREKESALPTLGVPAS